ncbi:MAG: response regulator [Micavibrio aeruginosavorus]|uniref:histidine kinase n=1 Tax=Micavibrio aeruginosavorus TaxID=349221 RepID=A0A7T5UH68_9BACT|nr:MAG: response regulator [Micavibrio aeruginosavorus]
MAAKLCKQQSYALVSAALVSGFIIVALFLLTFVAHRLIETEIRQRVLSYARIAAAMTDGDSHGEIFKARDKSDPRYQAIIDSYRTLIRSNEEIKYVYTFVDVGGTPHFIVDTPVDRDVTRTAEIMEPYPDASPELLQALRENKATVEREITQDEWGTFISAYAPIVDSRYQFTGVVGVDMEASRFISLKLKVLWLPVIGAILALVLGGFIYVLVLHREDAIEQERALQEAALQARQEKAALQERYASVVSNVPAMFFICRNDINRTAIFMNDRVEAVTGYPSEDFIGNKGRTFSSVIHAQDLAYVIKAVGEAIKEGKPYKIEYRIETAAGCIKWLLEQGTVVQHNGAAEIEGFAQDISERKEYEINLETLRRKAEEASRVKSEFVATVSHEIRTPMQAIIGAAELLNSTDMTESQRRYAHILHDAGRTLLNIVNDILETSKIEAGEISLVSEDFNIAEAAQAAHKLLAGHAAAKGLAYECRIDKSLPAYVRGDPHRIRQVITNLLANSIKFTGKGFVRLQVDVEDISDGHVTFRASVSDSGAGIPQADQAHIFEKFTQVREHQRPDVSGTGLGLNICRSLVGLMGGEIDFSSLEGYGSTFWFRLTLPVSDRMEAAGSGQGGKKKYKGRVLVADDVEFNREIFTAMLKNHGLEVDVVDNGDLAVRRFLQQPYDLVLLDLRMPGLDGYEAGKLIMQQRINRGEHTPVVALTAQASANDRRALIAFGFDDVLFKPATEAEVDILLEKIFMAP